MRRLPATVVATAMLAAAALPAGCATGAEKADQAMILGRSDPGARAVAGLTAEPQAGGGEVVEGRGPGLSPAPVGPGAVRVAEAAGASRTDAGAAAPAGPGAAEGRASRTGAREGIVVAVRGDRVYVDLGRDDGVEPGERLRVVRPGVPLVHPVTGETLGTVDEEVAQLEVVSVEEKFAAARIVRIAEGASIQPKDRVVAASGVEPPAAGPAASPPAPATSSPAAAAPAGVGLAPGRSVISQELEYEIRDLAVADLDGDGRVEVVTISQDRLFIYHWNGRSLQLRFEEEGETRRDYVSVDAADLDGDGRAELLVNDAFGARVDAAVYRQEGRRFVRHDLPRDHYFRIIGAEIGAPTLVGQRRGDGLTPFVGDVHRYEWRGSEARRGEALWLPVRTSIFDIQLYRAPGGRVELAAWSPLRHLRLFRGREEVWSSQQEFDGTKLRVLERNPKPPQSTVGEMQLETPIPGRIVPLPGVTGRDGEPVPAFVLRRNEKGSIIAPRYSFSRGVVLAIAVDGPVTRELWRTAPFDGYVAAYRVADLGPVESGIGGRALLVALDLQRGIFKAARSVVVVQPLR